MKKAWVLVFILCLLSGCDGKNTEMERGLALRTKLLQAQSCSFDASIVADYGDKLHRFSVSCKADNQGNLSFTVVKPDTISGITGTVTDSGGKLTFDDIALQFDTMADEQISPVTAPWIFLKTLRSGCITSAGMEDGSLRLSIDDRYEDDALRLDIWLDEKDLPKRSEILYDGKRILSLEVKSFQIL